MPAQPHAPSAASRHPGRHARRSISFIVLAGLLALSAAASARGPAACGEAVDPDAALRQVNEVRLRGATCPGGATWRAASVRWSDSLALAAQTQAREMARLERMSHVDGQNRGLAERLRATGYRFSTAVENVGVGYPSLGSIVQAWLESEGHCENLLDPAVLEFGLACMDADVTGAPAERRYWTLVLGAPPVRR